MKATIENLIWLQKEYSLLCDIYDCLGKFDERCTELDCDKETVAQVELMQKLVYDELTVTYNVANRMARELRLSNNLTRASRN